MHCRNSRQDALSASAKLSLREYHIGIDIQEVFGLILSRKERAAPFHPLYDFDDRSQLIDPPREIGPPMTGLKYPDLSCEIPAGLIHTGIRAFRRACGEKKHSHYCK